MGSTTNSFCNLLGKCSQTDFAVDSQSVFTSDRAQILRDVPFFNVGRAQSIRHSDQAMPALPGRIQVRRAARFAFQMKL